MKQPEDMIRNSIWAETLTPRELAQVCAESHEIHVKADTHLTQAGDAANNWYGVIDGVLIMTVSSAEGKESTFTGVRNGAWFGEGTLLKDGPWRYNSFAIRESHLVGVPRQTFKRLVQTSLPFNHFLLSQLNARLGLFISLVEYDRLLGPDARLARCLAALFNTDLYPQTGRFVELSQEEIGQLCALSRQRANEALQKLETAGLLRIEFGGVTVLDLPGLKKYSGSTTGRNSKARLKL